MLDGYLPPRLPLPRKRPSQKRSRRTLGWIQQATGELLLEHGREHLTTTLVAERAGVSIGTLYQYVSGVDELMAGLVEAHLEAERRALATVLAEADALPLPELVDRLVDAFVGVFAQDPALSSAIYEECRSAKWSPRTADLGTESVEAISKVLSDRVDETTVPDPELAALAVVSAVDAFVQRAAAQRPEAFAAGTVGRAARDLAGRYLFGHHGAPHPSSEAQPYVSDDVP